MLLAVAIQLMSPWLMKMVVDQAIPLKNYQLLTVLIIALAVFPFIITILNTIRNQVTYQIGGNVTDTLRHLLFDKLLKLSAKTYHHFQSGDIAGRIYSCGEVGDAYISQTVIPAIFNSAMLIGISVVMLYLNWKLAILILIFLPLMYYFVRKFAEKVQPKIHQIIQLQQELSSYSTELVAGLKTVQKFHQQATELQFQKRWIQKYRKLRNHTAFYDDLSVLIVDFGKTLGFGVVFSYAAVQIIQGQMTIGTLIAFSVYFPQLFSTVQHIQQAYLMGKSILPKLNLVYDILDLPNEVVDTTDEEQSIKGKICFNDVSFSYEKGRGELSHVHFSISAGEFIGIVGQTGSGKSTILDLIMIFYEADAGKILIDGKDITDYSYKSIRSQIGLVSQDVFLWNKSIYVNLQYANPTATHEEIVEACDQAQILSFIEHLPDGFDTIIGERGVKLSGGEKQRLGIAQMLLRNPKIILLDEPSSALDANTEALLQERFTYLFQGKTMLVVAHRLATIRYADRIIVMDKGKVADIGTHEQLMGRCEVYQKLYRKQVKI